jgi:hypothetical protein
MRDRRVEKTPQYRLEIIMDNNIATLTLTGLDVNYFATLVCRRDYIPSVKSEMVHAYNLYKFGIFRSYKNQKERGMS